jgi:hypothetical protein
MHVAELPLVPLLPGEFAPVPAEAAPGDPLTPLVPLVAFAVPVPFAPFAPVPVAPGEPLVALVPVVAFALPEPFAPAPDAAVPAPAAAPAAPAPAALAATGIERASMIALHFKILYVTVGLLVGGSPSSIAAKRRGSGNNGRSCSYFWSRNLFRSRE